jgi:hypothetical protein
MKVGERFNKDDIHRVFGMYVFFIKNDGSECHLSFYNT